MMVQTTLKPVHAVQKQIPEVLPGNSGGLTKPGKMGEVALRETAPKLGKQDCWIQKLVEERRTSQSSRRRIAPHSIRCDRTRWET